MNKKTWFGILCIGPLILNIISVIMIFFNVFAFFNRIIIISEMPMFDEVQRGQRIISTLVGMYMVIIIFALIMGIIDIIQKIILIIDIVKNKRINDTNRIIYIIFIIFATKITAVIYYILEILMNSKIEDNKNVKLIKE